MTSETTFTRRERRRLSDERAIITAALDVFTEKGFDGGTMQMIAERAELSVGTLYNFFDGKERLYQALVKDFAHRYEAEVYEAISSGEDERARITAFLRVKGEFFRDNLKMARLYLSQTRGQDLNMSGGLDPEDRSRFDRFRETLAGLFESGIRKGIFNKEDPYHLAVTLQSISTAFIFLWLKDPDRNSYSENIDTIARLFFDGATPRDSKEVDS